MAELHIGDTITCSDDDDLINTMHKLAVAGVETDFEYSMGYARLIVTEVK